MYAASSNCQNCQTPFQGEFCHACGEKRLSTRDKSLKHFLEETFAAFFFADGKFPLTLKNLLVRPGFLPRQYMLGIRRKYLSPIQLFFFANLVYFLTPLFPSTFDSSLEIQMNLLPYSRWTSQVVERHLEEENLDYETFRDRYNAKSTANSKLMLIFMVVLLGLALQLLFAGNSSFYLVDFLEAAACLMSFFLLFILIIFPGIIYFALILIDRRPDQFFQEPFTSISLLVLFFSYSTFLIRDGFARSMRGSLWRALLLTLLVIPCIFVYRFLLFWVTFWSV